MNPNWLRVIHQTAKSVTRRCPHCGKPAAYAPKQAGQFYTCKHCHHRFKEKNPTRG